MAKKFCLDLRDLFGKFANFRIWEAIFLLYNNKMMNFSLLFMHIFTKFSDSLYWKVTKIALYQKYELSFAHHLGMKYYVNFLGRWISAKIKVWHPWQLKKPKSWGPFWSYQLISTTNSAHLANFCGKWAELAELSSW